MGRQALLEVKELSEGGMLFFTTHQRQRVTSEDEYVVASRKD